MEAERTLPHKSSKNLFHNIGSEGVSMNDLTEHLFDADFNSDVFLFYKEQCDRLSKETLVQYAKCFGIQGLKHIEISILNFLSAAIGAHPMESPGKSMKPPRPLAVEDFEAIGKLLHNVRTMGASLCEGINILKSKNPEQ